jgi:glycosyltransferase involved in cell wall biosynthesis
MTDRTIKIVCGGGIVSGKEIVSLLLGRGLRAAGWNPEFITSKWGDGEFVRRLEHDGFEYQRLRLGFISASLRPGPLFMTLDQLRYWPELAYQYTRLMAATSPRAVIHTNWHHALLLLPFLDPHRDVFWVHDLLPNSPRYSRIFQAIGRRVGRIVCVSRAAAQNAIALGVPKSRVVVIHSGLSPFEPTSAPGGHPILRLGIVGQVGPWKGHDDLLDALALVSRDGVRILLRIFGAGTLSYIDLLKRRVNELGLQGQVEWCGVVKDPRAIYGNIDVCVVPSRCEEALGMSALEASAFGRPVVCTSRGGLPEVVDNGVTGFVVETEHPEQLGQAIRSLARDRDLIRVMGNSARERVQSKFALDRFVGQFTQVVEELDA